MNGLSKTAGMPQMKLAWMVVGGPAEYRAKALDLLDLIADTYLSVATPVQSALPQLLQVGDYVRPAIQKQVRENWAALADALRNVPANACHLEGGWTAIIRVPETRSEVDWVLHLMDDYDVLVQPGYFFDMTDGAHIVASLLTDPKIFSAGLCHLASALTRA